MKLVRLNVGGKTFHVNYDIINKSPVLYDKCTDISSDFDDDDEDDNDSSDQDDDPLEIFIDRNGEIFQGILEYWRSQTILSEDVEYLNKLKFEADYFLVRGLVSKVDEILKANEVNENDYDYQVIKHPFDCNYLIKPSNGDLKPYEEDAVIISGYKYCLSPNVYESKLVVKRPRKRSKPDDH